MSEVKNLIPSSTFCMRSLSFVRDDIDVILRDITQKNLYSVMQPSRSNVILKGFAEKNLPPSESTIAMLRVKARDSSSGYRPRSE